MPIRKPLPWPSSAIQALKRGSRTSSISRAAASARSAWSGCTSGAPNTAMIPSPDVADERAAVVHHRVDHLAEVAVEHLDHLVGGLGLREGGEAADVGEHHRALAAHPAEADIAVAARRARSSTTAAGTKRENVSTHALALERGDQVTAGRESHDRAQEQREERVDDRQHAPGLKASWRGRRRQMPRRRSRSRARAAAQPQAAQRRQEAEQQRSAAASTPGAGRAQRQAVEHRGDRVGLDLGAGHLAAAGRGRVDVLQRGRRGADDDDLVR